jgi:hypothetical protein
VDQRECCRAVPPERSRVPPVSRLQPTPPSTSCPGTPNVRRHAQPLHRHAATGQRQPWDRPDRPASRRRQEVRCNRRRPQHCFRPASRRADNWQGARWRTPTPPRAGSPPAPRSSPLPEPDRRTVADPSTQSRPVARCVGQLPGRHRPLSPRQRRQQEGSVPRYTPPRQLRHNGDDNLRAASAYELQHRGDPYAIHRPDRLRGYDRSGRQWCHSNSGVVGRQQAAAPWALCRCACPSTP